MTTTAVTLDPLVLDTLADSHLVDLVSRLVAFERGIRRELAAANPASFPEGTPTTITNAAGSKARAYRAQAQQEQAQVVDLLSRRVMKLVEDGARESEAS